jgi:N,N-dimethylformamidase
LEHFGMTTLPQDMIDTTAVLGYALPLAVAPGEGITFHFSSETLQEAMLEVVRVRCADPDPAGPGLELERPGAAIDGRIALRHQPIHPDSCLLVEDRGVFRGVTGFSAGCFIYATLRNGAEQTVMSR